MAISSTESAAAQFARHIDRMLDERAGALFAELGTGPLSFADCRERMLGLAQAFGRIGLAAGDRALIRSQDDAHVITLFLAMLRTGVTPVIADGAATDAECAGLVDLCDVRAVFADRALAVPHGVTVVTLAAGAGGEPLAGLLANAGSAAFPVLPALDTALMVLTSGTTSTPKAIELSHGNLMAQLDIFRQVYGFGPDSRVLDPMPLHHADGLLKGPLSSLWFGGSFFRVTPFSVQAVPALLESVARERITHLITVPAMMRIIDRVGCDHRQAFATPDFRFVLSSADALDAALWRRFEENFGVPVANIYGLSEVTCDALFAGPEPETRRIGTVGRPVGCTARLVDAAGNEVAPGETGELVLSGPTVMRGYFNAPEATAEVVRQGAFYTGDYMRQDEDGLFVFVGRKKTAIVSAGKTIHPEAATQALGTMPGVLEAFAFGVPDPAMGERLVAAIVPAPGHTVTEAEAAAHCRAILSPERAPREYRIVEALPRGPSGKVQIEKLSALAGQPAGDKPGVLDLAAGVFNVAVETLSPESTPFNTAGWDSLAHLTLIEAVEEAYGIRFTALQIAQIMSLEDVITYLDEALAEA